MTARNAPSSERPPACRTPPGPSRNPAYSTSPGPPVVPRPVLLIPLWKGTSLLFTCQPWRFLNPHTNSKQTKQRCSSRRRIPARAKRNSLGREYQASHHGDSDHSAGGYVIWSRRLPPLHQPTRAPTFYPAAQRIAMSRQTGGAGARESARETPGG